MVVTIDLEKPFFLSKIGGGWTSGTTVTDFSGPGVSTSLENEGDAYELFKEYVVISDLLVRKEEYLDSPIVGDILAGDMVTVLDIGCSRFDPRTSSMSGRRLKVSDSMGSIMGWITCVSVNGECKLRKKRTRTFSNSSGAASRASFASTATRGAVASMLNWPDPELVLASKVAVGDLLEAARKVTIREGESMTSPIVKENVKRGTKIRIMEIGWCNPNRVKVNADGCIGWISILDKAQGKPLMGIRNYPEIN